MKVYDLVEKILKRDPQSRNSDKQLIWEVYKAIGIVKNVEWFGDREAVIKENFLSASIPSTETIRRTREKLQASKPELGPTDATVIQKRKKKQDTKSTFIYREEVRQALI